MWNEQWTPEIWIIVLVMKEEGRDRKYLMNLSQRSQRWGWGNIILQLLYRIRVQTMESRCISQILNFSLWTIWTYLFLRTHYVSHVAEITAEDLQPGMGISTPQPNKCELEQFLCDIKFKRKQIKLCREFNPDMRLLGNAILHHRKSITDPREAERLLGLALKK